VDIFLDSMVYLKSVPVREIDFCRILGSDSVTVQLPRVTLRELEQLKVSHPSSWTRDRAAQVLACFDSLITLGDQVHPGVDLHFISSTPHVEMAKYGLNPEWNDDWLIATVLEWKKSHSAADTMLMTDGIDARLTCRHLQIDTVELPGKYRHQHVRNAEKYVGGLR
jgi:predicted ribonuclease YlaK